MGNAMVFMESCLDWPLSKILEIIQDRIVNESTYFGILTQKSPLDYWIYQEIIFETKPNVIVEIGNYCGGSALAFAHIFDRMDNGKVICIDIDHSNIAPQVRDHPRIQLFPGDACSIFDELMQVINGEENVMVVEDSSHEYKNTLEILKKYSQLIPVGGYFIVEDSICHHGLKIGPKPGPFEAIEEFIKVNEDFKIDRTRESFCITWNPKGYLVKIK